MCLKTGWVANIVNPDKKPHLVMSDLGLHCFPRSVCLRINMVNCIQIVNFYGRNKYTYCITVFSTVFQGCVYIKCSSCEKAYEAYQSLHGWWFDGMYQRT